MRHDGSLSDLSVVYTPLHGSGLRVRRTKLLGRAWRRTADARRGAGKDPDGHFPTCPYPNPEIPEAMALGLACCGRVHPDLLIGTDPDCDRCGVAVPDDKRADTGCSPGNEIGVLLLDYLCRTAAMQNGAMPQNPVAVTTIVSTDMADAIAAHYGVELRRTLTGFKFIGEQIGLLESEGPSGTLSCLALKKATAISLARHVRDKDGVNAVLLRLRGWRASIASRGMTLSDAMDALYRESTAILACAQKSVCLLRRAAPCRKWQACMAASAGRPARRPSPASASPASRTTSTQQTGLPRVRRSRIPPGCPAAKLIRPPLRHRTQTQMLPHRPRPLRLRRKAPPLRTGARLLGPAERAVRRIVCSRKTAKRFPSAKKTSTSPRTNPVAPRPVLVFIRNG